MAEHNTILALKNALSAAVRNGGPTGKLTTDGVYDAFIEAIDNIGLTKLKLTVAKEDIYTVFSVPPVLMEAPGEDKIIIPVLIVAEKTAGSAFSGINDITVRHGNGADNLLTMKAAGFLDQTTQKIIFCSNYTSINGVVNEPLILYSGKDPDAAGGSDINLWIYYREIDLS